MHPIIILYFNNNIKIILLWLKKDNYNKSNRSFQVNIFGTEIWRRNGLGYINYIIFLSSSVYAKRRVGIKKRLLYNIYFFIKLYYCIYNK